MAKLVRHAEYLPYIPEIIKHYNRQRENLDNMRMLLLDRQIQDFRHLTIYLRGMSVEELAESLHRQPTSVRKTLAVSSMRVKRYLQLKEMKRL